MIFCLEKKQKIRYGAIRMKELINTAGQFPLLVVTWAIKGGWVMWPLLFCGGLMFGVLLERFWLLDLYRRRHQGLERFLQPFLPSLPAGTPSLSGLSWDPINGWPFPSLDAGLDSSPLACLIQKARKAWGKSPEELEYVLGQEMAAWLVFLEKRLAWVNTVITAAPLLGLLGTVTGMMASFQSLSEQGTTSLNAVTGGVSEALIATATGLLIALIGLFGYNHFQHQIRTWTQQMEAFSHFLLACHRSEQLPPPHCSSHAAETPSPL